MRYFSILAFGMFCAPAAYAQQVAFEGALGLYQIEAELIDTDDGLEGFWAHDETDYPATLTPVRGALGNLQVPDTAEFDGSW